MIFLLWIGVNSVIGYSIGKNKNDIPSCVLLSVLLGAHWLGNRAWNRGQRAQMPVLRGAD